MLNIVLSHAILWVELERNMSEFWEVRPMDKSF